MIKWLFSRWTYSKFFQFSFPLHIIGILSSFKLQSNNVNNFKLFHVALVRFLIALFDKLKLSELFFFYIIWVFKFLGTQKGKYSENQKLAIHFLQTELGWWGLFQLFSSIQYFFPNQKDIFQLIFVMITLKFTNQGVYFYLSERCWSN